MGTELTARTKTPPVWLLNSLRNEMRPHPNGTDVIDDYYNTSAAIEFNAEGIPAVAAFSDKKRLVPFGEFIPGGKWMEMKNVPVISYEIIFSGFTPRKKGETHPKWILNQSNDAWYGNSSGPLQHSNMATYRAIEEGLPVIRAASNGISGIINPYCRLHCQSLYLHIALTIYFSY